MSDLTRRQLLARTGLMAGALAAPGLLSACGSGAGNQTGTGPGKGAASGSGKSGPFKIVLSNSYIGNQWRLEMVNSFKAALKMPPFKGVVEGSYFNAGNDVPSQSAQLNNIISSQPDAILIDAASPTALNGVLQQAARAGILVISFDNTVTAKGTYKIICDQVDFGRQGAQWLAKQMGGKGNVLMVTGVPGTTVDADRNKGAQEVFSKNPGIKVVNKIDGQWDSAVAQREMTKVLPSLPKLDGIWCQGGTDGVIKALISAGRPIPPVVGEAENGFRKFMSKNGYEGKKVTGFSIGQPVYLVLGALQLAVDILSGKRPKGDAKMAFPIAENKDIVEGKTVFKDLPDSFFDAFTGSGSDAAVVLCSDAAQKGTACPGSLNIKLG